MCWPSTLSGNLVYFPTNIFFKGILIFFTFINLGKGLSLWLGKAEKDGLGIFRPHSINKRPLRKAVWWPVYYFGAPSFSLSFK